MIIRISRQRSFTKSLPGVFTASLTPAPSSILVLRHLLHPRLMPLCPHCRLPPYKPYECQTIIRLLQTPISPTLQIHSLNRAHLVLTPSPPAPPLPHQTPSPERLQASGTPSLNSGVLLRVLAWGVLFGVGNSWGVGGLKPRFLWRPLWFLALVSPHRGCFWESAILGGVLCVMGLLVVSVYCAVVWRVRECGFVWGGRGMWLVIYIWWWRGTKKGPDRAQNTISVPVGVSVNNANEMKEILCSKWVEPRFWLREAFRV